MEERPKWRQRQSFNEQQLRAISSPFPLHLLLRRTVFGSISSEIEFFLELCQEQVSGELIVPVLSHFDRSRLGKGGEDRGRQRETHTERRELETYGRDRREGGGERGQCKSERAEEEEEEEEEVHQEEVHQVRKQPASQAGQLSKSISFSPSS
jgi:hypothetical protein